jgi:hypothetical protein
MLAHLWLLCFLSNMELTVSSTTLQSLRVGLEFHTFVALLTAGAEWEEVCFHTSVQALNKAD